MSLTAAKTLPELQAALTRDLDRLLGGVASGRVGTNEFLTTSQQIFDLAHSRAAVLGIFRTGAKVPPLAAALGVPARAALSQREFVAGFLADVRGGRYDPKREGGAGAQSRRARAALYADRLVGTANEAWRQVMALAGVDVRWRMRSGVEHCPTCRAESAVGWRPAGSLTRVPGDGTTACRVCCRCVMVTQDGRESYAVH